MTASVDSGRSLMMACTVAAGRHSFSVRASAASGDINRRLF